MGMGHMDLMDTQEFSYQNPHYLLSTYLTIPHNHKLSGRDREASCFSFIGGHI
jgi:hypothetical protein